MKRKQDQEFVDQTAPDPTVAEEEETEELDPKKKDVPDLVMEAWNTRKSGPSDEKIEQWKSQYGEVYLMSFDAQESYVWRPITRIEYKQLIKAAKDDPHFQELLVTKCVLWPAVGPEFLTGTKAGTIPTLYAVIMEGSNFLDPNEAVMYVRKL